MTEDKWVVDSKGGPGADFWEISVLRSSNNHGKRSFGWFGVDKLFISGNGGPCREKVDERIWKGLLLLAGQVASELNEKIP